MNKIFWSLIFTTLALGLSRAQSSEGRFCLEYFPQAIVETYVDSLVSYLTREMGSDGEELDSTTKDYIEHFASLATRKSKCVYFAPDSILIHEKVDQELTNAYLIVPTNNQLISRDQTGLIEQPYFIEGSAESGYFDFQVSTDKTDTKVIEGFPCYRVEVTELFFAPGEESAREKKYILYVTDELSLSGGYLAGINMSRIVGCPLEIQEPLNSKVNIAYRASGLRLSLPQGIFKTL